MSNMIKVAKALRKNAEEFATCGPGETIRKVMFEVARAIERFLVAHLERFDGLRALRVGEQLARYAGGIR